MKKFKKLSLTSIMFVSLAFVVSVRNLPMIADTGMKMFFFGLLAAILFALPAAFVSAELATGWPKRGGIYIWVREAFGEKAGFFAIWMQWSYMMISQIAMLYFVAGSLAYVIDPNLAKSRLFLLIVSLIILWGSTYLNSKGITLSAKISKIGFLSGVAFPGVVIITLGIIYWFSNKPIQIDLSFTKKSLIPDFSQLSSLVLLIGFIRSYAGLEASAVHANNVENPKKNYPIAIFAVVLIGFILFILGSFSVGSIVPVKDLSLIAGILQAIDLFLTDFNLKWFVPVMAILVAIGQTGSIVTWLMGPVKGVYESALNGDLPKFFRKTNKAKAPINLLIIQAISVSIILASLLLFSQLNIAFFYSVALSIMLYLTMYVLMFIAGIHLRYSQPKVNRKYKVPFKNIGMWIVASIGIITSLFCIFISFFPPKELSDKDPKIYMLTLAIFIVVLILLPILIIKTKKESWKPKKNEKVE
ncbi:MAG: Glutamate/gamma-aminobutyrate antiporter [Candidatus Anoxychlamydiales bacterium]|nr:Glutamate/gamma-aminobutyrate antiporter [Candidatus Anoxychlamydiales bacterium]